MALILPESIKILLRAIRDIFLFSPDKELIEEIKGLCNPIMEQYRFVPVFYDITKTGRHLWVAIYFQIEMGSLAVHDLSEALKATNRTVNEKFHTCTCELILEP